MNILLNEESYITVELFYIPVQKSGRENLIVFYDKKIIPDEVKDKVRTIKGKFKIPDFGLHSEIVKESTTYRPDGTPYVNRALYKGHIIKNLLKKIELDDKAQEINDANYKLIEPVIGDNLFFKFDQEYLNPEITVEELLKINEEKEVKKD